MGIDIYMDNEFNEKIVVKLDNTKPVEVMDFLNSIHGFQKEYKKIAESYNLKYNDDDVKLYIRVKEGCIEWIFTTLKIKAVQDAFTFTVSDPSKKLLKITWDKVMNIINKVKNEESVELEEKVDLENTQKILQPTKNDLASKFSWEYSDGDKQEKLTFEISGASGRGIHDKLTDIIDKRTPHNITDEFNNEILQLKIHETPQGGIKIKGIIDSISDEEKTIILDKSIMQRIIEDNKNPFSIYYIVHGNVKKLKSDNKIMAYIITEIVDTIEEKLT